MTGLLLLIFENRIYVQGSPETVCVISDALWVQLIDLSEGSEMTNDLSCQSQRTAVLSRASEAVRVTDNGNDCCERRS